MAWDLSTPVFFVARAGEQGLVACPVRSRWLGANHAVRWEAWVSGTGPKQNVAVYRKIGSRAKRGTHGFVDLQMSRIIVLRSGTTRHSYLCTVDSSLYSSSFDVSSRRCAKDGMYPTRTGIALCPGPVEEKHRGRVRGLKQ